MNTKWNVLWAMLCAAAMAFALTGCEDSDGGGHAETVVVTNVVDGEVVVETVVVEEAGGAAAESVEGEAEETEGLTDQPADEGVVDDAGGEEEETARVPFGKQIPTGLAATKVGGGVLTPLRYTLSCNPVPGAARHVFTTSLGTSDTAGALNPQVTVSIPLSGEKKVIFEVYAVDRFGMPSRTARHTFMPR
ncbi:MAG: hypothetical protein KA248_08675 [Kiritimatiellae bacterium]|nr:hypothetical protein [Kiritimatiellia bacterium]